MANVVDGFFMRLLCLMALFSFSHSSIVIEGGVGSTTVSILTDDRNLVSQVADLEAKVNKLAIWSEDHPYVQQLVNRIVELEQKTDRQAGKIGTLDRKTAQQLKEIETLERTTTRQLEEIQSLKTTIMEREKEWRIVPSSFENQLNSSQKLVLETVDSKLGTFKQMEIRKLEQSFQDTMAQHRRERLQETQGVNGILAKQGKEFDQAKLRLVSLEKSVTEIVKNNTDAFDALKELFLNSTTHNERKMTVKLAHSSKVPSSCADLRLAGQTVSGLYQVQTKNTGSGKISTVFCDMATGSETFVGINDIKSTEIHFSVARTTSIVCNCTIITYDHQWVNIGNAMNASTGVFTAPKAGIYSFTFNAVGSDGNEGWIEIRRNDNSVAKSWITAGKTHSSSASAHVTISLKTGDQVDTYSPSAKLFSSNKFYSINFSGSLIAQL